MGQHIHFKDGKFAVWSTVSDHYESDWMTEAELIRWLRIDAIADAIDEFEREIPARIERAKANGCSAHKPFTCEEIFEPMSLRQSLDHVQALKKIFHSCKLHNLQRHTENLEKGILEELQSSPSYSGFVFNAGERE